MAGFYSVYEKRELQAGCPALKANCIYVQAGIDDRLRCKQQPVSRTGSRALSKTAAWIHLAHWNLMKATAAYLFDNKKACHHPTWTDGNFTDDKSQLNKKIICMVSAYW